jgi:glycosyltransferase involved in cell wall biosynthesis
MSAPEADRGRPAPGPPRRLRVLWVLSKLEWGGGIGRVAPGALAALAERGHEVHVAGPAAGPPPEPIAGVRLHAWPARRSRLLRLPALWRTLRWVAPEIVHFHSALPHFEDLAAARLWRRLPAAPGSAALLVTPYTSTRADHRKRRHRLGLRAADAVVAASGWSAEQAVRAGAPASRTRVVHSGIAPPERAGPDAREPLVLFLGRLVPVKGVDVLLAGFEAAATSRPGWRLLIGGTGREEARLRARAASGPCAARIEFLGPVSGEPKGRLLERAAIGVVPSRAENFPGSLLEFQAHGLACLASAVGGIPELALGGAAARLVPPGDPGALARALGELMDDEPERRRLAAAGRARSRDLAWPRMAERLEEVYREAAARREAPRAPRPA